MNANAINNTAVGFDLDGVVADIVEQILAFAHSKLNITLSREQLISEDVELCTALSRENLVEFFSDPTFFITLRPMKGIRRLLTLIRMGGHTLHFVTDRFWYPELHRDTERWLHSFALPFDSLHFARKTDKQLIARDIGLAWFLGRSIVKCEHAGEAL